MNKKKETNKKFSILNIKRFINFQTIILLIKSISYEKTINFFKINNSSEIKRSLFLFWIIGFFCILTVVWASVSNINQVVRANAEVTPESQVHLIQSAMPGPIEKISVKLGDSIKKGDELILVGYSSSKNNYLLALDEVTAREKKVKILDDLYKKGAESEIRLIDEKLLLLDAKRRFESAERALTYSKVTSSVNGVVSQVMAKNIGQVVSTGSDLVEIVPDNANLRLRVLVADKDIAFVRRDLKAKIAFNSFDMAIYGQFDGVVKTVSASTSLQGPDKVPFYIAIVEVDKKEIKRLKNIDIQSGMQASVSIIGDERTIISYLFNPITKLAKTALRE